MATSRQLHRLATSPADMMRFQRTGQLPPGVQPASPLISLLEKVGGQHLVLIRGLVVDERLGYLGSRRFDTASQALRWLKPAAEVFGTFPAEGWRMKAFSKQLSLEDVAECSQSVPNELLLLCGSGRRRTTGPRP